MFGQLADLFSTRTSVSDSDEYRAVCASAALDRAAFAVFKRDHAYNVVLEHVSCEQGARYLELALAAEPRLLARLEDFRRNDRHGSPRVCAYGAYGAFSPTTLRYVKVLADLLRLFGPLDGMRVLEIGGGYGGQRFVVSVVAETASYTLVDLEPCLALQRAYLDRLGVGARYVLPGELPAQGDYDLVVSNYAFSECVGREQRRYLERALARARRGYLTMTWENPSHYRSLTRAALE